MEDVNDDVNVNDAVNVNDDESETMINIHSDIGTNATLNFFTKPSYLSKIKKKYTDESRGNNILKHNESIKFYKKRIVSLFKDILKGDDEVSNCNNDLKHIGNLFITQSIRYFQSVDKKDIIQQEHSITKEEEESTNFIQNDILCDNLDSMEDANSLMMRKTVEIPSLDNYVIQKTDQDNSNSVKKIIPLKMNIDLNNPILKTKGVKPKRLKKNIKKDEGISETNISETNISETSISETSISEKEISQ